MKDTLILLSGGLDSAVLLASERQRIGLALFIDYGQPAEREEAWAAQSLCRLPVMHGDSNIPLRFLRLPMTGMADMQANPGGGARVVPARNLIFIAHAVSIAIDRGLSRVIYGATGGDESAYVDCRDVFVSAVNGCAELFGVRVEAPLMALPKSEVVALGKRIGASVALSWSCYRPVMGRPCLVCNACVERAAAQKA